MISLEESNSFDLGIELGIYNLEKHAVDFSYQTNLKIIGPEDISD